VEVAPLRIQFFYKVNSTLTRAQRRGGRQPHGGQGGGEDHAQTDGQGATHVKELVAGGTHGDRGQATDNATSIKSGAREDRSAHEADGCDYGAQDGTVHSPGQLLGSQTRLVLNGAGHRPAADDQSQRSNGRLCG